MVINFGDSDCRIISSLLSGPLQDPDTLYSVHVYARAHSSIDIYIYIYVFFIYSPSRSAIRCIKISYACVAPSDSKDKAPTTRSAGKRGRRERGRERAPERQGRAGGRARRRRGREERADNVYYTRQLNTTPYMLKYADNSIGQTFILEISKAQERNSVIVRDPKRVQEIFWFSGKYISH